MYSHTAGMATMRPNAVVMRASAIPADTDASDPPPPDAAKDDVRAMRRSLRTWVALFLVWGVGLVVWVAYLVLIGLAVLAVFHS